MRHKRTTHALMTGLGLATAAGVIALTFPVAEVEASPNAAMPESVTVTGVIRDFRARQEPGGHPDFQRQPAAGFGHYMGNIAMELDADGKPVFTGQGRKVSSQWRDANNRAIHPSLFDPSMGDRAGSWGVFDPGGIQSQETFRQWFRDVPGVNMSKPLSITLKRNPSTGRYVFDDRHDPLYANLGGFFPINGQLFGNYASTGKNFHFTYELVMEFVHEAGAGHVFTFRGDDDVWVFVDGRLVIDIGGVHSAIEQTVELDRLDWLKDGQAYKIHFFFCERHTTEANFRIETTLNLRSGELPSTMAMFD